MASTRGVDIVRITQKELENLAGKTSKNTERPRRKDHGDTDTRHTAPRPRKEKKRPDMAIYRPGMSRLSRRTTPASDQSEESSGTEISPNKPVRSEGNKDVSPPKPVRAPNQDVSQPKSDRAPKKDVSPPKSVRAPPQKDVSPPKSVRPLQKDFSRPNSVRAPPQKNVSPPKSVRAPPRKDVSPPKSIRAPPQKDVSLLKSVKSVKASNKEVSPPKSVRPPSQKDVSPPKPFKQSPSTERSPPKSVKPSFGTPPDALPGQRSSQPPALMSLVVDSSSVVSSTSRSKTPASKRDTNVPSTGRPAQQRLSEKVQNYDDGEWKTISRPEPESETRKLAKERSSESRKSDASNKRQGDVSRKEQLKVQIGGKVTEPAQISPTTVELIKTWKGDAKVVSSIQEPPGISESAGSISKGKGPLRGDDKLTELDPEEYEPKPQRTGRRRGEDRARAGTSEISKGDRERKSGGEAHPESDTEEAAILSGPDENAAEWDWVKELMNEEPPAEPKFYHAKIRESDAIPQVETQVSQDNKDQRKPDRASLPAKQTTDGEKKDVQRKDGGRSQRDARHEPVKDEKQGIAGGGRDQGGGTGGGTGRKERYGKKDRRDEDDWSDDLMETEEKKFSTRLKSSGRTKRANQDREERRQPVGRDADRKTGRVQSGSRRRDTRETVSHGGRNQRDARREPVKDEKRGTAGRLETRETASHGGRNQRDARHEPVEDEKRGTAGRLETRETASHSGRNQHDARREPVGDEKRGRAGRPDTRETASHHGKRPERALYVNPKRAERWATEEKHGGRRREDHGGNVDDHESTSREVAVSPDKDLRITVKTDQSRDVENKKSRDVEDVDRKQPHGRENKHKSRRRFHSGGSSSGDEAHQREDAVRDVSSQLDNLYLKKVHRETSSMRDSGSSNDSDRDRSHRESTRHPRRRHEDEDRRSNAASMRNKDQHRDDSRKDKHHQHVKFGEEDDRRKYGSDCDDSDSERYMRSKNRDLRSKRGRETRQRDERHHDARQRERGERSEEEISEHHPKGGGLLRLPSGVPSGTEPRSIPPRTDIPGDHSAYSPHYDKHYPHGMSHSPSDTRHKPESRPRTADKSRLWDPSKPQKKPALPDKHSDREELQFYDPEEEKQQPREGRISPDPRSAYPSYYPPAAGYPVGYYPGMVPQGYIPPGYYPPPQQPAPPTSWAEQVDKASGMPITPPPGACTGPSYNQFPPLSAATAPASDPYQLTPQEIQQGSGGMQNIHQQSAMRMLREASSMDIELTNVSSRGLRGNDCIDRAISIQHDLEKVCGKLLLLDLDACNKYNVEQLLWKSAYYQLIEALRKQPDPIGVHKEYLMNMLDHGTDFYKGILSKLESGYKFSLENYSGMDPLRDEKRRSVKLALLSAQRCMIALGDIARYKELANDTSNYGQARSWYLKGQQLVPKNGRPYNQLAILALYTRRKLDAVYYYMRSVAASNQFLTARESLMSLFEEVRKKSHNKEQEELRIRREKEQAKAKARRERAKRFLRRSEDEDHWRQEVWVSHDGVRSDAHGEVKENEEETEEAKLRKMSPVEVNKKFVLSFLNAHGKLFTNIGMEAFPHVVDKLLREFSVLLTHSPPPINSTRLIQLMAINMYAAHHTQRQEPEAENMRSLQQEQAVQLGLDMFGLLVVKCTTLLKENIADNPSETHLLHEDLHELLPGIKVFADWLMCHIHLWNPPPNCTEMPYGAAVDVWKALAEFFNTTRQINTSAVSFIKPEPEDCTEIRLPEDLALSGFVPLMSLPLQPVFVPAGTDKIVAMDCTRINSLHFFAEYLCGLEMPLLAWKSKGGFSSVAPEYIHADPEADVVEELIDDDDVIVEDYTEEDEGESTEADRDINRLRERKEDLERKFQQQQRKKAQIQAIVESHRHQRKMEIEIHPVYLVPDTNCFIDHLLAIQMLVSCKRYTLVVPLVVINELDGLAKGSREGQYNDPIHAYQVQTGASSAVQYLEDQFDRGNKHVRALTGKGTVMDTITFRSEESGNKGNNDDLILRCCLHYCEDKARDYMPHKKDAPIHLLREVVLLTNDRNLRVKGLNQNVPVRDVVSFIKWAKL